MNTKDVLTVVLDGLVASSIEVVDLTGSKVRCYDDGDIAEISAAMQGNTSMTRLDLSLNSMSDEGAGVLSEALKGFTGPLRDLEVDSNKITAVGLMKLLNSLPSSLRRLDVSGNNLASDGIGMAITAALKGTALQSLIIRDVGLSNEDLIAFCEWISDPSCALTSLELSGNEFTDDVIDSLRRSLELNSTLRNLNVSNCRFFDIAPLISEKFLSNTGLSTFVASTNGKRFMTPELEQALKNNKRLYAPDSSSPLLQLKAEHTLALRLQRVEYERRIAALEKELAAKS